MNSKIKNYVDVLFSDIPRSNKARELKEEMLSNMSERFDDYIKAGKTENQAYSLVISSLGDIDEMLAEVMPSDEFLNSANYYRKRNARNTAISVAMYIVGVVFLIGFATIGDYLGNQDFYAVIGLLILLLISAVATGIIIYSNMSMPLEYKDYNARMSEEFKMMDSKQGRIFKNILSIYWLMVTFIYLAISFTTMQWGITWIIWVLAGVFESIVKTIFEMRYGDDE